MDIPSQQRRSTTPLHDRTDDDWCDPTDPATIARMVTKARWIARRFHHVDTCAWDDMESDAMLGVTKALQSYDPSKGASLGTYVDQRVRGEIQDGLRARDHLSRAMRDREKRGETVPQAPISLESMLDNLDRPIELVDLTDPDPIAQLREEVAHSRQAHALLQYADLIDPRSATILRRYYLGGEHMIDIGRSLNLTESRISQIIKRALERLRSHLLTDA